GLARGAGERAQGGAERAVLVAEPLLAELDDLAQVAQPLARLVVGLGELLEQDRAIRVLAGRLVERAEDRGGARPELVVVERCAHRRQRAARRRIDREHAGPALERLARARERPVEE